MIHRSISFSKHTCTHTFLYLNIVYLLCIGNHFFYIDSLTIFAYREENIFFVKIGF